MQSMTGYGRASLESEGRQITIELKSVNHRFLDLNIKMPKSFLFLEDIARKTIARRVSRGHLDVYVTYINSREDSKIVTVDKALVKGYINALSEIADMAGLNKSAALSNISTLEGVMCVTENEDDADSIKKLFTQALEEALEQLNAMRKNEGASMKADLLAIIDEIEEQNKLIVQRYPQTVAEYQNRLKTKMDELLTGSIDEARIVQEVAIMADRSAIDEETVRLNSHIRQAREKCADEHPAGRALDFIVQEMNREVNTISSKSQDIAITQSVIKCKAAIEKLREQLQNIE